MNLVVWLVVGGLMGCVAGVIMQADGRPRVVGNMVVGIAGALAGGWLLSPLVGGSTADQADVSGLALLVSVVCATTFLAIANLRRTNYARIDLPPS